jgi:archaellum biogenesis ATPase FlaH
VKIVKGALTQDEIERVKKSNEKIYVNSSLELFKSHNGLRRGEVSVVIGPYGNGKSTFIRTILIDLLRAKQKTLLFLSEESRNKYLEPLNTMLNKKVGVENAEKILSNILIATQYQMTEKEKKFEVFFNEIKNAVALKGVQAIVIDNITTSFIGRMSPYEQPKFYEELKTIAIDYDLVLICVAHTRKGANLLVDDISGEDVRGNATLANIGSYNYVITTYFECKPPRTFIKIDKARYHPKANKQFYEMEFDADSALFLKDKESSYEIKKEVMKTIKRKGYEPPPPKIEVKPYID